MDLFAILARQIVHPVRDRSPAAPARTALADPFTTASAPPERPPLRRPPYQRSPVLSPGTRSRPLFGLDAYARQRGAR